jgi:hypothetical protein
MMRVCDGGRAALRAILLFAVLSVLAVSSSTPGDHPRWTVHVASGKGSSYVEKPICHSLKYFVSDPKRFDYDGDLFGKKPSEIKDKVDSQRIGEVAGYTVRQVTHTINDGDLIMKMIFVVRADDSLCEIYHQQMAGVIVSVEPAYFVQVGPETILSTTDPVSGNGVWREEAYWTFDKDGPIELRVNDKIDEIQKELLPKGLVVMNGSAFNVGSLTYDSPVWGPDDAHCCPSGGNIRIEFALKDHRLTVVSQAYKKN